MFKKTAIAAGIGLAVSAGAHADYRWEVAPAITGGDVNSISVDGTFYLESVDTSKGPLSEAAFQDHSSFVSVNYTDGETDDDNDIAALDDLEFERYSIDGRYVFDLFGMEDWIVDAGYERSEPDNPLFAVGGPEELEIDIFTFGAGKYLTDNTTLVVTYQNTDVDEGGDFDSYRVDLEHLFDTSFGGIKVEAAYGFVDVDDGDDIDVYELDAIYYPWNNFGIGAAYRNTDQDGTEVEEYGVLAEYFITENVAISLSYFDAELDDADVDADAYTFGARIRF